MVKHIILWNLKETYSDGEKDEIRKNISTMPMQVSRNGTYSRLFFRMPATASRA